MFPGREYTCLLPRYRSTRWELVIANKFVFVERSVMGTSLAGNKQGKERASGWSDVGCIRLVGKVSARPGTGPGIVGSHRHSKARMGNRASSQRWGAQVRIGCDGT